MRLRLEHPEFRHAGVDPSITEQPEQQHPPLQAPRPPPASPQSRYRVGPYEARNRPKGHPTQSELALQLVGRADPLHEENGPDVVPGFADRPPLQVYEPR